MPRSDRLSDLMARLRRGGIQRAESLARDLGVSVRTVYRDLDTLRSAGVPVSGTRGTGYRITADVSLPPLHLQADEMEALQVGLTAVAQTGDPDLAAAAARLSEKLDAAMPEDGVAPRPVAAATRALPHLPTLRGAIRARQKILVDGATLRPLRLEFWGRLWTLLAWDERAEDFVDLPVDRMRRVEGLPSLFVDEAGKRAVDYLRAAREV